VRKHFKAGGNDSARKKQIERKRERGEKKKSPGLYFCVLERESERARKKGREGGRENF
jgi:hypothetical protein